MCLNFLVKTYLLGVEQYSHALPRPFIAHKGEGPHDVLQNVGPVVVVDSVDMWREISAGARRVP